jgi:hypothetical protein
LAPASLGSPSRTPTRSDPTTADPGMSQVPKLRVGFEMRISLL